MRKFIALLLTLAMALSLVVIAGATDTETGSVYLRTEKKVNGDKTVTYTFTLDASQCSGVAALEFIVAPTNLTYDKTKESYPDREKLLEVFTLEEENFNGGVSTPLGFHPGANKFLAFGGNAAEGRILTGTVKVIALTYQITGDNYGLKVTSFKACLSGEQAALEKTRYTCVAEDVKDSTGVTVSGTVTSWNDQNVAVYLYPTTGTDLSIRKALKEGDTSGALATATVGTVSGPNSRKYEQTYSISGVEPGEYRLVAHKSGYAAHIETVTLDSGEIDKSLTIYRLGDINLDGKVSGIDRIILARYLANWHGVYDEAIVNGEITWNIADINLDGKVSGIDRIILARYLANWHGVYDEYFE